MISDAELRQLERNLPHLDPLHKQRVLDLLQERDRQAKLTEAREHFLPFVKLMWADFIPGAHHTIMAEAFERVAAGKLRRLIINMAPRHTKSELASVMLPAWFLGRFPKKKVIQASNTEALAAGFGRRVRNMISGVNDEADIDTEQAFQFNDIFPGVNLAKDSQAAAGWHTNRRGEYFAIGVNGKVTGKGGDLVIIDDPHALEINTEIPTPNGFVQMRDLRVGDQVFGADGTPATIVAKSPVVENRRLYEVTTNDGASVLCDAGHLWAYRRGTNVGLGFTTGETRMLAQWDKPNKPIIPSTLPVAHPEADLPIDPYCFGYWLGNGTATLGRITCHLDDVAYIRSQFDAAGYETTDQTDPHNFGVLGLRAQLMDLGVFDDKHIPEAYLTASVEQRMALLQGLMDSDGDVTRAGQCSFNNTNTRLVDGVRQIVHSLGARCSSARLIPPGATGYSAKTENYRTCFKLQDACRIPRKRERTYTPTDKRGRSITVRDTGATGSVQCITIDRADGLFLAGRGYMVTHNSEQEAKQAETNPEVFDSVYNWFTSGPRQRLQPGGAIIVVMTRWARRDLTGQVLKRMAERDDGGAGDKWEVIELPAILDEGEPTERSMWPGFWSLKELQDTREDIGPVKFKAQYQQQPTSEQSAIIKRESWRSWGSDGDRCPDPRYQYIWDNASPPPCDYIISSWDTAAKKNERADYSAMTNWGVFSVLDKDTGKEINHAILLSAYKARLEFPELKRRVKLFYDEDSPDTLLIEDKGSGIGLIQELRSTGVPVENFSYGRGKIGASNDKIARANMVADIFASGYVWAPARRFAEEVIEECAEFPNGEHDDYVDTVVQAMLRFRTGGFIRTANDDDEKDDLRRFKRKRFY